MTPFVGGKFEASGVAAVPGADGVLFVDNGREGQVFWMGLDQNGLQVGEIKALGLGVGIKDIEGITTDGTHFYVVSSQSRQKAIDALGLVRFKFQTRDQSIENVEAISELKKFLVENVAELRATGDKMGNEGGLNIEGLAWDPRQGRLLLGLRSPIIDGHALLVPLKFRDPRASFTLDNLEVEGAQAIQLSLKGGGIRGIEYDSRANLFRMISGAPEDQAKTDFGLWEWSGDEQQSVLRETDRIDGDLKPEGVARVTAAGRDFLMIVFDAGGYTVMNWVMLIARRGCGAEHWMRVSLEDLTPKVLANFSPGQRPGYGVIQHVDANAESVCVGLGHQDSHPTSEPGAVATGSYA